MSLILQEHLSYNLNLSIINFKQNLPTAFLIMTFLVKVERMVDNKLEQSKHLLVYDLSSHFPISLQAISLNFSRKVVQYHCNKSRLKLSFDTPDLLGFQVIDLITLFTLELYTQKFSSKISQKRSHRICLYSLTRTRDNYAHYKITRAFPKNNPRNYRNREYVKRGIISQRCHSSADLHKTYFIRNFDLSVTRL